VPALICCIKIHFFLCCCIVYARNNSPCCNLVSAFSILKPRLLYLFPFSSSHCLQTALALSPFSHRSGNPIFLFTPQLHQLSLSSSHQPGNAIFLFNAVLTGIRTCPIRLWQNRITASCQPASAPALFAFGKTGSQHLFANRRIQHYDHSILSLRPCHHTMPYILSLRPCYQTMPSLAASAHLHHLHLDIQ
jgi:hypothetical protein